MTKTDINIKKDSKNLSRTNIYLIGALLILTLFVAVSYSLAPQQALYGTLILLGAAAAFRAAIAWPDLFVVLALWTTFLKEFFIPRLVISDFGATPFMVFTSLAAVGYGFQILTRKRRFIRPTGLGFLLLFIAVTTVSLLIVADFRVAIGVYMRTGLNWLLLFLIVQTIQVIS